MANDLVVAQKDTAVLALGRLQSAVQSFYATIAQDRFGADVMPTLPSMAFRKELDGRRKELNSLLRPISLASEERKRVGAEVLAFLAGFLDARGTRETVALYVSHFADQPMFAILAALDDFKNGRVWDTKADGTRLPFTVDRAPSAYRMLDQIKKRASDLQEERFRISRVLAVKKTLEPEVPKAERDRVQVLLSELADHMRIGVAARNAEDRERNRAEAQAARDRAARITKKDGAESAA
jgi:hypothetical protein